MTGFLSGCADRFGLGRTQGALVAEGADELLEVAGHAGELGGGALAVGGAGGGGVRGAGDAGHVRGDLGRAPRRIGHVAGDLVGGRGLLFDGAGDGVLDVVDAGDDLGDFADGGDGALGVALDRLDLGRDVLGGGGGLFGKFFDLVGDDGEALAGFTGAGGLDGGVEGEEVGLLGDRR
jgi:hypothetical protein